MTAMPIRIGFCTDLSGPFQGVDGPAGADAIRWAIADHGGAAAGRPIELLLGDHRNDVAEASAIATRWCAPGGADMIVSGVNSDTSLALTDVAARHGKPVFVVGAGTSVQTRERPSPYVIQYAYSTLAVATALGLVLTRRGETPWFFITAEYPFGRELEEHCAAAVIGAGGTVAGGRVNPHGATDFRPFLEAARESGATVVGIANAHAELVAAMDAMRGLGLRGTMTAAGLFTMIEDVHHMGLEQASGLYLADSWYWSRDDAAREWGRRFMAQWGRMPSSLQAADYSAALQYLRAVDAVGSASPDAVLAYLANTELTDMYVKAGRVRNDGTMLHDMHVLRVKAPADCHEPWDYYEPVATVSGEDAFPLS